jgi:excisionase family DNA binding protein
MKRRSSPPIEPGYFDLNGASAYTGGGLSVRTLRRLIAEPGGIPFIHVGTGKILIKRTDLDAWLEARRHVPLDLDRLAAKAVAELTKKETPVDKTGAAKR